MSRATLINAVLFQVVWFACVLGGAAGTSLWGALTVLALVAFSAWVGMLRHDLPFVCAGLFAGFALDTGWIQLGILDYGGAQVAPAWIVLLWCGLGLTLNHSMQMFTARPLLGGVLAGATAPLSYLGGERLGAVSVPDPVAMAWVGLVWAVVFWGAFAWARSGIERRALAAAPDAEPA